MSELWLTGRKTQQSQRKTGHTKAAYAQLSVFVFGVGGWRGGVSVFSKGSDTNVHVCFGSSSLASGSKCFLQTWKICTSLSVGVTLTPASTICSAGCQVGKPTHRFHYQSWHDVLGNRQQDQDRWLRRFNELWNTPIICDFSRLCTILCTTPSVTGNLLQVKHRLFQVTAVVLLLIKANN